MCVQLTGTAVFAIGLWLRLDPKTKNLFEGPDSPYVFYTGETRPVHMQTGFLLQLLDSLSYKRCILVCDVLFLCLGVYILIGAGAVMMVVGFLGCCGAIQESPWMLGVVRIN